MAYDISNGFAKEDQMQLLQQTLVELLTQGRTVEVRVHGNSMLPILVSGVLVRARNCAFDSLRLGDLVFFTVGSRLILHRIVGKRNGCYVCQGDALPCPDPMMDQASFVGRVASVNYIGRWFTADAFTLKAYGFIVRSLQPIWGTISWYTICIMIKIVRVFKNRAV